MATHVRSHLWLQSAEATFHTLRQYLDDAAYSHSVFWDDGEAPDRTTRLLLELMLNS
jgi:hypothetical protein